MCKVYTIVISIDIYRQKNTDKDRLVDEDLKEATEILTKFVARSRFSEEHESRYRARTNVDRPKLFE